MRSAKCEIHKKVFNTPLGWAGVAVSEKGVCRVVLPRKERKAVERELGSAGCGVRSAEKHDADARAVLAKAVKLLQAYFTGKHVLFDLPIDMCSFTAFQRAVWRAASAVPFGETRSYGWIATRIRKPLAARAVGQAMGANPVPVFIP